MGQAAKRKKRLGEFYGQPIGPGHPDFVPPKKPESIRPLLRFDTGGETVEARVDGFDVYADRVVVRFADDSRESNWPMREDGCSSGTLTIGSRKFRDATFAGYIPTGCVFLRSQPAREEPGKSEPTEVSSEEHRTQEEPIAEPQRRVLTMPARRPGFMFSLLAVTMLGMTSIPEPEYRPKKR